MYLEEKVFPDFIRLLLLLLFTEVAFMAEVISSSERGEKYMTEFFNKVLCAGMSEAITGISRACACMMESGKSFT